MPDDPDRSHDTDPLADTQAHDSTPPAESSRGAARRSVQKGDTLGRYELVEDIGEGGMATVYRARDKELRREVAVKVLFPHLARREEVVRRFHREARAAAGLEHANILRVYDVGGEAPEPPYIVMELVRGRSLLGELEQRGAMLAEVAACIGAVLADALSVAHKAGIIHRDIKPANVMIDAKGRVLLADFGVARLETEDSLVTKTGALLGTPAYMSPEQASGDVATAKSDLYSLGATLYQLATGSLPYAGSPAKVMAQIAQGQLVPAVKKKATVGPDLSRVIDRMMASDPAARPESAASVAAELRAIAAAGGLGEPADELGAYFADSAAFTKQKLPAIAAAVVAAANKAIAENKLPRAIALADRGSALAPDDPAVLAVVDRITEGGRASRRRRVLAIAGIGVIAAGGIAFGALQLFGQSPRSAVAAAQDAGVGGPHDATFVATTPDDAGGSLVAPAPDDASVAATGRDAGGQPMLVDGRERVDAGVGASRVRDAGVASGRTRDASVAMSRVDAAVAAAVTPRADAAVAAATAADAGVAAPATGFIVVKNDTWCDVSIDGVSKGRNGKAIAVEAGHHSVVCEQKATGHQWTKAIDVPAGKTVTVEGTMLGAVAITLDVDALVGGVPYRRGQTVSVKAGQVEVVVGGAKAWVTVRAPCVVRSIPTLGCY